MTDTNTAANFDSIMIDLETMGTRPDAAVVSIGAVAFSTEHRVIGPTFYARVALETAVAQGGTMDPSTVLWWMQQSGAARYDVHGTGSSPISEALTNFTRFVERFDSPSVWGNGAAFDNVILRSAYKRAGLHAPWSYSLDRCYRTLRALHRDIPEPPRVGVYHNALDDAMHQTMHLLRIL